MIPFQAPIADAMAIVWEFFQPLLFGLIGAEVSVEYMDSTLIGMRYLIPPWIDKPYSKMASILIFFCLHSN